MLAVVLPAIAIGAMMDGLSVKLAETRNLRQVIHDAGGQQNGTRGHRVVGADDFEYSIGLIFASQMPRVGHLAIVNLHPITFCLLAPTVAQLAGADAVLAKKAMD